MKKVLQLIALVIYCDSFGMEKALCDLKICADKKQADELFFPGRNALEILEGNWKKGGHMAAHYPLNRFNRLYTGNIFSAALRKRKSANFIRYLIECGANVRLEQENDYDTMVFDEAHYCLPIALASYKDHKGTCYESLSPLIFLQIY